jgi:hypothetical protein
VVTKTDNHEWVFLLHRLPREPSAPRISLWRAVRRLGAVLVGDGLVALPASARTIEHLEWLAAGIRENAGEASVWIARPTTRRDSERLARQSRAAVEDEYRAVIREASSAARRDHDQLELARSLRRLRRQLHAVSTRDFFGAPSADKARAAVEALADVPTKVLA